MATETLSYSQLGDRLSWPEAARTLVRRLQLPRQKVKFLPAIFSVGDDGRRRLVRHGHLPEREIMTGIGPVAVRCPRVRDRTPGKGAGASVSRQQASRNPSAQ
jgi:hypothetical protein